MFFEINAKLAIQQMIRSGALELTWSDILEFENNDNPHLERRTQIAEWKNLAFEKIAFNETIFAKSQKYMKLGLRDKDALHVACAVFGGCDFFITVDKKILNKAIREIAVINPVTFLWRLQNVN